MTNDSSPYEPSLPWRTGSSIIMGLAGSLCRIFMFGASNPDIHGLDRFQELLDERADVDKRQRGLITVSNHISISSFSIDDPLIWGALPFSYAFNPSNLRWSTGSYDLCFTNKVFSTFFTFGQVLPTHRSAHSTYGGLFQPTMTQAVRLLSRQPFSQAYNSAHEPTNIEHRPDPSVLSPDISDPFSSPHLTYSTDGTDTFPAPSSYPSRKYAWIHIFPEGRVHQHPRKTMRYFKWGVARLILEPDVCPDIVPMWIEGNDQVYNEEREWPRFVPRPGKTLGIWFGENVGGARDNVFTELRRKWRELAEDERKQRDSSKGHEELGVLSEGLKYGKAAIELRIECTRRVRDEVLKVRRIRGLPDEDPKNGLVETWLEEGGKREGRMKDGSLVKDV
ncbi:hypothetical protein MMC11_007532 [Xylographa trunciseda]|nr:hypothetical protein [Xylographa trunciseda]